MASEIRVNKITHTTGVGTITTSVDGIVVSGIVTANNFSGSVPASNLTGTVADARISTLTASKLSGALPAISAANLTNLPAANITGTLPAIDGSALTGINTAFGNSSVNTTGIITATAFVPTVGQLSHRNIIVNGAMNVAQRGTSSTSQGYQTVDRITPYTDNIGVTATYSQVDVTSGGAYDAGFRKAWQVTKGSGTANTNSQVNMGYKIEAQDIANSGWKYTDPNSYITISFWLKTSVSNHNPQLLLINADQSPGTKNYFVDIPALTANTWTKITHSIPGHANQVYNNDNGNGFEFQIIAWYGTDYTDSGNTPNAWTSFGTKPVDTTWLTTNNSTFQVTGLQLEVGSVATPFEHRSYGEELRRCQRYFFALNNSNSTYYWFHPIDTSSTYRRCNITFPTTMRTGPTASELAGNNNGSSGTPSGTQHADPDHIDIHWNSSGLVELTHGHFSAEL